MKVTSLLIIEDHHTLRSSLNSWLSELFSNLIIYQASTGEEGLELAKKYNPDLALIDIGLPDINGIEVTKSIKNIGLKTDIIVLTMLDDQNYQRESLSAGAKIFIKKNEMYAKLPQAIASIIESQNMNSLAAQNI